MRTLRPELLAEFYDGDSASLFKLLMGRNASDSVRFWQWRTLIRVAINNEIDYDTLRSLLARAFDDLEQERSDVWSGWESVIIYFGLTDLVPLVEGAHAAERMFERTMGDFNREWAYAAPIPSARSGRSHRVLSWSDGRARLRDREPLTETSHQR